MNCFGQSKDSAKVVFSGYIDAYYAFYRDSVGINNFQKFPSIDPRSETFGLNTAMVTARYNSEKIRGVITLHYGDIAKSTWSPEFNNIMEAHVNVRLHKKIWLGAGFFRTHLGTEGLLPNENFTSSVSVHTFYEPYFESGLRLKYEANDKFFINFYILNGFNIFEENNNKKSIGVLSTYTFRENVSIGYSNYIGDDSPLADSITHLRIHQNIFFNYQYKKIKMQLGGDYCMQENSDLNDANNTATMFSGVLSLKYQHTDKAAIYGRGEIFNDPDGFMSGIVIGNKGLDLSGFTIGLEYKPAENSYVRLEGRRLITDNDQKIFHYNSTDLNHRDEILFNVGVSF
jgi:hypothetical protein